MFDRLVKQLNLGPAQVAKFRNQLGPLTRNRIDSMRLTEPTHAYRELSIDSFQIIAEWYHYAILELTHVDAFQSNTKWVAARLGISVSEVNAAIERLQRLDMLKIDASGKWKDVSEFVTNIKTDLSTVAKRKHQQQILKQAEIALEEVSLDLRDQTSMTMAIATEHLPAFKAKIGKFRRELCAFAASQESKDQVYHLSVSFFPVTQITETTSRRRNYHVK